MALGSGHKRVVRTLYRHLLSQAKRVGREPNASYLQLQDAPTKDMYSKLYSVPPGHDRELLDKYIPYYLKPHFEKTAYTSKELYDTIRLCFREMKGLQRRSRQPSRDEAVDDAFQLLKLLNTQVHMLSCTSITETRGVRILCTSVPAPSDVSVPPPPWVFYYQVRVENWSKSTVQLVSRHWVIEDAQGRECDSVPKGSPGVVGQQPLLRPGDKIVYVSGTNLPTPVGAMHGSFQMVNVDADEDDRFDALVNRFRLISHGRRAT